MNRSKQESEIESLVLRMFQSLFSWMNRSKCDEAGVPMPVEKVSILVLVDESLEDCHNSFKDLKEYVSILVLVDESLEALGKCHTSNVGEFQSLFSWMNRSKDNNISGVFNSGGVSILVLVDESLEVFLSSLLAVASFSFNPCSRG